MTLGKITKSLGIAGAAVGAAAGVAYLSQSKNREKLKKQIQNLVGKENADYVKKLGRPGAVGAQDDSKMVGEGALTSVQYYNELQQQASDEEKNEKYLKKVGRPGAVGAKEDSKMVDEGALTSVQYYNKHQERKSEEEDK